MDTDRIMIRGGCRYGDTTRWNGYRQEHTSGGDIVIQLHQERRRYRKDMERGDHSVYLEEASGKGSV